MATLTPVDHDPFADAAPSPAGPKLTPVENDPFAGQPPAAAAPPQRLSFGERVANQIPGVSAVAGLARGAGEEFSGVYGRRQETPFTALGATLAQLVRGGAEGVGSVVEGAEKGGEALAGKGAYRPGDIAPPETTQGIANVALAMQGGLGGPASLGADTTVSALARAAPAAAKSAAAKVSEAAKSLRATPQDAETKALQKAAGKVSTALSGGAAPGAADISQEVSAARKTGQPFTLADVESPDVKNLVGTIYRQGGAAAKRIADFFKERNAGATERVEGIIKDQLADGSLYQTEKDLKAIRTAHAAEPFEKAMSHAPVWSPRLQTFLNEPDMKGWMRAGYDRMRKEATADNKPFNPHDFSVVDFNDAGEPIFGPVPTMRLLAAAKTGLDGKIEELLRGGKMTDEARVLIKFRNAYRKELDSLNGDYGAARDIWEGDSANLSALRDGQRLFEKGYFRIDEIPEYVANMSGSERQNFILGVADELKARLRDKVDSADKGSIINTEGARLRLRPLFGSDEAAGKFLADIERESVMKRAPTKITGGSDSAERLEADRRSREYMSAGQHLLHGHPVRAGTALAAQAVKRLWDSRKTDPALNDAIARILTDPAVARRAADMGEVGKGGSLVVPPLRMNAPPSFTPPTP